MKRLGVNIDHVATLRNARGEKHPNPITAAKYLIKLDPINPKPPVTNTLYFFIKIWEGFFVYLSKVI